jgi:hypothetical protein
MAATFCEEQVAASAVRLNGEETDPFPGLLTVTPANAELVRIASADEPMESFWSRFMKKAFAYREYLRPNVKRARACPWSSTLKQG